VRQVLVTGWGRGRDTAPGDAERQGVTDGFDAVVIDPKRRVADRYGLSSAGGVVVIRPDGYIGLFAERDDPDAVADYLASHWRDAGADADIDVDAPAARRQ
jgi:hypothetical protein